ncbi:uncharacterized protein ARMOST_12387 [Armillaria ostoyae]|uniref:Uncharacterized protein n=1 Tax=Armillaria ostoyae TaxID=47428 RepID=A0A284RJT0_ARMOS|nr:uncharacterized protein ARMOST_12387 [Armillaria ostoyae]
MGQLTIPTFSLACSLPLSLASPVFGEPVYGSFRVARFGGILRHRRDCFVIGRITCAVLASSIECPNKPSVKTSCQGVSWESEKELADVMAGKMTGDLDTTVTRLDHIPTTQQDLMPTTAIIEGLRITLSSCFSHITNLAGVKDVAQVLLDIPQSRKPPL